jgi:hypothetical protein
MLRPEFQICSMYACDGKRSNFALSSDRVFFMSLLFAECLALNLDWVNQHQDLNPNL